MSSTDKIRLVDADGNDVVGDHLEGELLLQSHAMMEGYLNNAEASKTTIIGGWLHTGDIAYQKDDLWYIVDRQKVGVLTC